MQNHLIIFSSLLRSIFETVNFWNNFFDQNIFLILDISFSLNFATFFERLCNVEELYHCTTTCGADNPRDEIGPNISPFLGPQWIIYLKTQLQEWPSVHTVTNLNHHNIISRLQSV